MNRKSSNAKSIAAPPFAAGCAQSFVRGNCTGSGLATVVLALIMFCSGCSEGKKTGKDIRGVFFFFIGETIHAVFNVHRDRVATNGATAGQSQRA